MKRPSGHDISDKFSFDNGAAIPPNLLALPNTESNSFYLRYCKNNQIKPHPARFSAELPEFFIRMLTDPADFVFDPFAGSCVTGEVCERLRQRWLCTDLVEDYLKGALGRFVNRSSSASSSRDGGDGPSYYRIPRPGLLWNGEDDDRLPSDGGRIRPQKRTWPDRRDDQQDHPRQPRLITEERATSVASDKSDSATEPSRQ